MKISNAPEHKGGLRLNPIAQRVLMLLTAAGLTSCQLVTDNNSKKVQKTLRGYKEIEGGGHIHDGDTHDSKHDSADKNGKAKQTSGQPHEKVTMPDGTELTIYKKDAAFQQLDANNHTHFVPHDKDHAKNGAHGHDNTGSMVEVKAAPKKPAPVKPAVKEVKQQAPRLKPLLLNSDGITYTVQPGDTLSSIANRIGGVSVDDLKKWNNVSDTLFTGRHLIVQNNQ